MGSIGTDGVRVGGDGRARRRRRSFRTIGVALVALAALAAMAAGAGPASAAAAKTTICHRTGNGSGQEISVANSAVPAHLAHGDNIGPCRAPDTTKPTVTLTTPAAGAVYDQGQAVNADFSCADEAGGSGLASCVGTVANGAAVATSTLGTRTFTVTARDNAGNETVVTRTYTVRDVTRPTVTLTTPAAGAVYDQGQAVNADFSCADEAGGSGLDTCVGTVANGDPVGTNALGEHTFTVTARDNAGNETVVTRTYTVRDVTKPTVTLTTPAAGAVYDQGQAVDADFSCADEAGGSGLDTCVGTVANGDPVGTNALGEHTFTVTARDNAGNETVVTRTYTVNAVVAPDTTRPTVTLTTPAAGAVYDQGQTVDADFSCADEAGGSGLASCVGTVANGDPIGTAALGEHTFTVTARDNAGNETVVTRTYTVNAVVVPDTTRPTVTLTTPAAGAVYDQGQTVNADFSCADEAGGSGLASCVGTVANGDPIGTAALGEHTFTVTARDNAGNETVVTRTYTVRDVTRPTVTLTTPAAGAVYDQGQAVNADFSCADEAGGSGLASCVGTVANGDPVGTAALGEHTFTVTARDNAGNETVVTRTYTVNAVVVPDTTRPTVTLTTPAAGAVYDQGQAVNADFSCADEAGGSGLDTCVGTVANGAAVATSTLGTRTFTVTARDNAGNETVVTRTYTVNAVVVPDTTRPTVTLTTPTTGVNVLPSITLSGLVANYACADEVGGSGLASCVGTVANGATIPIDLATFGSDLTFTVTARDNAGNQTVVTRTYSVACPEFTLFNPNGLFCDATLYSQPDGV